MLSKLLDMSDALNLPKFGIPSAAITFAVRFLLRYFNRAENIVDY